MSGIFSGPAHDWISADTGIYARRISFKMKNARAQTATCDLLSLASDGTNVTLTCSSAAPGLKIFYTVDGSTPASDAAINPNTQLYSAPFPAAAGTLVRAAAFAAGYNQSAIKQINL